MLLHACDTDAASSGSPLLVDGDDGPEVVGINVGTYVRSRVITHDGQVVQRLDQEVIANTALLAAPLAGRIRTMTQDGILSRPTEIRRIQEKLAKLGMFSGARDGRYGPITRNAIEAYESRMKFPVTGIATRGLLERLEAVEAVTASK